MYVPDHFAFPDGATDRLHRLIEAHNFGILVAPAGEPPRLEATHLPFVLERGRGPLGTLIGHVARANPIWTGFSRSGEVLAIFQGPHAYVSPDWYANAGLVPTWNYVAVHAYGTPRLIEDDRAVQERLAQLAALMEEGLRPKPPWTTDRVPEGTLRALRRGIVTFEIEIARLDGKQKLNQNRTAADRAGVVRALEVSDDPEGAAVARLMRALDPT